MIIHRIDARDLPDLWFQAVHDILDVGRSFKIDRGSYEGQTRLEYDYFVAHVKYPGTKPLLPDIPLLLIFRIQWRKHISMVATDTTAPISNIL